MVTRPLLLAVGLAFLTVLPLPLAAQAVASGGVEATAGIAALTGTMQIGPLFDLLRDEAIVYGRTLEEEMFPGGGGPRWASEVAAIYDVSKLRKEFDAALTEALADDPDAVAASTVFFGTERGQRILTLEIEARRTLMDDAASEAAEVAADKLRAGRDRRIDLIRRLIEAGDLIEMNVAGSLSGNLAYLQGLTEEGGGGTDIPQDQLMSDVWAQEDQIRGDTQTWLYSYLLLAYEPLSDDDLRAYIDFSETEAGRKLNGAFFTAFDSVFAEASRQLGRAAGRAMLGRDI